MSGSLSGGLWGLVLGSVGLGVVSLVNEPPGSDAAPAVPQQTAPEVAAVADPSADVVAAPATDETVDVVVVAPEVTEPVVEAVPPSVDTTPIAPPQAPDLNALLTSPEAVSGSNPGDVTPDGGSSRVAAAALQAPAPEVEIAISTAPAAPPEPADVVVKEATASLPEVTSEEPAPVLGDAESPLALAPEEPTVTAPEVVEDPVTPAVVSQSPDVVAPEADTSAEIAVVVPEETPEVTEPSPEAPQPLIVTEDPALQAPEPAPLIVTTPEPAPVEELPATTTVRVNRPGATPSEAAGQAADVVEAEPLPDDAPAIERYASAYEGDPELPLLAIVMIDPGDTENGPADIAALPVPVTVVINALQPDAGERMTAYRNAGVEVMLQTALPQGAVPTDVEVAFEAAFDILPETVGFFSDASGILQGNRSVAEQIVQILGAEGRGLVLVERGLSNSLRIAEQAGLPAAAVLRDLDGDGEDSAAVARALDQAAFRVRQSGNAVLLARASEETLVALQTWGAENNGDQVGLAPVSAILRNASETE